MKNIYLKKPMFTFWKYFLRFSMIVSGCISAFFGITSLFLGVLVFRSGFSVFLVLVKNEGYDYSRLNVLKFYITLPLIGILTAIIFLYHRKIFKVLYEALKDFKRNILTLSSALDTLNTIIYCLKMIILVHIVFKLYAYLVIDPYQNSNIVSPENGTELIQSFSMFYSFFKHTQFNLFTAIFLLGGSLILREIISDNIEKGNRLESLEKESALVI